MPPPKSHSSTGKEELAPLENENILEELECMVCHEYMYPPIKQCTTGHSMCELCFAKVSNCPTCKSSKASTRNFALEAIHSKVLVPCKYRDGGCTVLKIGAEIRVHQEFCEYGERPCPLKDSANCTWVGRPKELLKHAEQNHDQHVPIINNHDAHIKNFVQKSGEGKHYQLINACDKIFKYCVNLTFSKNIIEWCVMFVGPREQASTYSYIIEFVDMNKKKEQHAIVATCQPLVDDNNQIFNSKCTAIVHFDRLKEFCGADNNLYFHFKVFQAKELKGCI